MILCVWFRSKVLDSGKKMCCDQKSQLLVVVFGLERGPPKLNCQLEETKGLIKAVCLRSSHEELNHWKSGSNDK